jgi:TolB-like protein
MPTQVAPPSQRAAQGGLLIAAVIGLLSLAVAGRWLLAPPTLQVAADTGNLAPTGSDTAPAESSAVPVSSIVVLPFINLSGDSKQDYVADGITDSLISDLARALPGASVISRDTAFTYKGRGADARQIGRELDVRYLLEGSVVVDGERVRVNIRLVDTRDGGQLGAERFDTARSTILQVQDEIVTRVARAIGLKVVDIEARRSLRERPNSTEVADLILRGKAVLNRPSSPATMIDARGLFEQVLKEQPDDADGLAGVATTLVFEFVNGYYEAEGGAAARAGQVRGRHRARAGGHRGESQRPLGLQGDRPVHDVSRAVAAGARLVQQGRPYRPARSGPLDLARFARSRAHPAGTRRGGHPRAARRARRQSGQSVVARVPRRRLCAARPR